MYFIISYANGDDDDDYLCDDGCLYVYVYLDYDHCQFLYRNQIKYLVLIICLF